MSGFRSILITAALLTGVIAVDSAWPQERVMLGSKHVSDRSERDTIQVGKARGTFRKLQVTVSGSAVEFKRVVVHFANGDEQVFEKNRIVGKGDSSGRIDLEGGARLIDKVVFYYEARSKGWKGADIKLFGIR